MKLNDQFGNLSQYCEMFIMVGTNWIGSDNSNAC
jgi:hypothetical protein